MRAVGVGSGSPQPRPYGLHMVRDRTGEGGNRRSVSRRESRKRVDRATAQATPAGPSRRRPKLSLAHRNSSVEGVRGKHCKGDLVPTLRPLLAVAGPPPQYGPKPCFTWALAGGLAASSALVGAAQRRPSCRSAELVLRCAVTIKARSGVGVNRTSSESLRLARSIPK